MNQTNTASPLTAKSPPLLPHADLIEDVRRLSQVSEWKGIAAIGSQWLFIVFTISGFHLIGPMIGSAWIGLYIVAVVLIASRQHCLLSIMHEATHYRISQHRKWNDFTSDMFCAFPLGISTELYRRDHLLHHQYTSTDRDPNWVGMQSHEDWHWPKDQLNAIRLFVSDLVGLAAHKTLLFLFMWSPLQATINRTLILSASERLRLITFLAVSLTLLSIFHFWLLFLMFWIVPSLSVLGFLLRLRSLAEHSVVEGTHALNMTRHVDVSWWERLTLAPLNVNYHLAHHLYPSVPFYNLPQLHAKLLRVEVFQKNAHITNGYLGGGVFREITRGDVS